jgi:alpha-amylase
MPALAPAQSASNGFWQAQSIYQIITDRFFDGDPSNNNADGNYNASGTGSVHGGDFRGIEQKLDYIKALGATAIWISPVVLNANGEFHGYAGRNFYAVAPHWGTLADLQHMTAAAHARGLLVIDDIIVNHGGDLVYGSAGGSTYPNFLAPPAGYNLFYRNSKQYAAPFNTNALNPNLTNVFHNNGNIADFGNTQQVELGELSGLDDFRTESTYVRSNMVEIYKYWIGQAGFDGFRIDTVKHVEMGFWQYWCPLIHDYAASIGKSNFFMFGEVYDGSNPKCGSYTGTKAGGPFALDSVVHYPLFFKMSSVFATATDNTQQIEAQYNLIAANYDPAAQMRLVTFLDNHDQPRFLSAGGATPARLNVALAFLYSSRGVPCLYYGTEQAFNGTTDPNDREDMFDGAFEQGPSLGDNFNMTHPQFLMVAKLNNFRRLYPALQIGSHVNKWNDPSGPGLFAYARRSGTQEVFVVFNTSASTQTLTNRSTIFAPGTTLVNLFDTNETLTVTATPEIPPIIVPSTTAKIFVSQSDWQPLDPVIISNSPVHDAASAPTYSAIVLKFSGPMDTNTVQSAFSTTPAISGTFGWNGSRDLMTFTPGGAGLPQLTMITVKLTNTAVSAVSGKPMFASYELRFRTAVSSVQDLVPPTNSIQSPLNSALISGNVVVSGTATDNIAVQKIEVRVDAGAWALAIGTNTWSYTVNSSNFLNGSHLISVRATDTSNNLSATNSVSVRFVNIPGTYLQRISGGNPANVTDCAANLWLHDQPYSVGSFGYSGGTTGFVGSAVNGVCAGAQTLYQRERYSTSANGFLYQFDCPQGVYEITLLEAETYWTAVGKRVFNAFIQGRQVLTNFDIFSAAGGMNLPLSRVFTNSVTNAQLQVLFTPVVDNARISGIQVRKLADVYTDSDGIPDWWRLAYFDHPTGLAADKSRGGDDADNDGATNLAEFLAGTNPLDAASVFKISSLVNLGSNTFQISWPARTNKLYQLQVLDLLNNSPLWSDLGLAVTGSDTVITQTLAGTNSSSLLLRIRAQ